MVHRRFVGLALAGVVGCEDPPAPTPGPEPAPPPAASAPRAASPPEACPADMTLAEGRFCPAAEERCIEHHPEYRSDPTRSERCLAFEEPSRCVSERRVLLRFCVDRYEWPNREGERPLVLVDFAQASLACESVGKRLCDETEWLFACEGEEMLPYVTGYRREPVACVVDRPYVERPRPLEHWDACLASPTCRRDFEQVDRREPAGSHPACKSPSGAFDMNGNVNEWVNLPDQRYPHRSGLKGGWWGPVRSRCRPTVRFHDESDWGYEIGFRCCRNARP